MWQCWHCESDVEDKDVQVNYYLHTMEAIHKKCKRTISTTNELINKRLKTVARIRYPDMQWD